MSNRISLSRSLCLPLLIAGVFPLVANAQGETLQQSLTNEPLEALVQQVQREGSPIRGSVLFHQPHLSCTKCHTCGGKEGESPLGPDLARPDPENHTVGKIIESLLEPSKSIRHGYEGITISRIDGTIVTGIFVSETDDAIVLKDPAAAGKQIVIPKDQIEERIVSRQSLMPEGQVNLLSSKQQFLDLISYLTEAATFGPARARSLRPDPSVINPPLPAYERNLNHAALISGWNDEAFQRGEALYGRICASCHGTKEAPGSMPTSRRFAEEKLRNGSDPHSIYRTLTHGFGMMAAQTTLVPREKYDLVHYLREAYFKPYQESQYIPIDEAYLASLPQGTSLGPSGRTPEPWKSMNYGPTLTGIYEFGNDGKNFAHKGIAIRLDPGEGGVVRGKQFMVFEHDTLRMAGGWTGEGFIDWNAIQFNGRHEIQPRPVGTIQFQTANGPGWANPETGEFTDARLVGRDGKHYGPLPKSWGKYKGMYDSGDRIVLSYSIGETDVLESPAAVTTDGETVFTRAFEIGPRPRPMTLRVLLHPEGTAGIAKMQVAPTENGSLATFSDDSPIRSPLLAGSLNEPAGAEWRPAEDGHLLLQIPAGEDPLQFTVWLGQIAPEKGASETAQLVATQAPSTDLSPLTHGGPRRWSETLRTSIQRDADDRPFAADTYTLPKRNPWNAQMRLTGLDFLPGRDEMLIVAWDGDVWRVTGLNEDEQSWQRIASGLFQPLGLKVLDGNVYVNCRDQIVRLVDLNGDGETDFYDCYNNDHQVTESFHEFAMGLQADAEGNFYYAKASRHAKPAVVPHHGTLLRVNKDGSGTDVLATGFRAPNGVCLNPDGTYFVTDQEGNWIPKNRINWIRPEKRFYGYFYGYSDVTDPSDAAQEEPLCWITNNFDRSPSELLWVDSPTWGNLNGSLLNPSYGYGKLFILPHERVGDMMQGGMIALPLPQFPSGVIRGRFRPEDGDLYLCGMYAWAGNQHAPGGLYRVRATGKPVTLPIGYHVTADGLMLTFNEPLQPESCVDPRNFGLKVWNLKRAETYGSDHYDERPLPVTGVRLSDDHRSVTLTIPDLQPTRGLELWYSVINAGGEDVDGLLHGSVNCMGQPSDKTGITKADSKAQE